MCDYCFGRGNEIIHGKSVKTKDWKETAGYKDNVLWLLEPGYKKSLLEMFILKCKEDKRAGLLIDTGHGARYIDINYCPFCGRKLIIEEVEE